MLCYSQTNIGTDGDIDRIFTLLFNQTVPITERKGGIPIPNRILKESICISDTVDKLDLFSEVFFYRLIVNADDYGRMDARPAILRARLFPLRSISERKIAEALQTLHAAGCVELYEVDGAPYLCLPSWDRHQTIRAKRSKFPPPPSASTCKQMHADASRCSRNPIQSESVSESQSEPPTGLGEMERAFERFWRAYPRQQRKFDAWQMWKSLAPDEALTDRIIAAVRAAAHSKQWQRENGQFIPYPENYLRGRRWEDKLPTAAPTGMVASNLDTAAMDELVSRFVPREGGT